MDKRLSIEAYLTVEELEQRYRAARDAVARSQRQIIWLLGGGATSQEVAAVTGYSVPWIRELAKRYKRLRAAGIGDGRMRDPSEEPVKQSDHALDATRYALHTELGEHAATEAYLAEMQRYVGMVGMGAPHGMIGQ